MRRSFSKNFHRIGGKHGTWNGILYVIYKLRQVIYCSSFRILQKTRTILYRPDEVFIWSFQLSTRPNIFLWEVKSAIYIPNSLVSVIHIYRLCDFLLRKVSMSTLRCSYGLLTRTDGKQKFRRSSIMTSGTKYLSFCKTKPTDFIKHAWRYLFEALNPASTASMRGLSTLVRICLPWHYKVSCCSLCEHLSVKLPALSCPSINKRRYKPERSI